MAVVSFWGNSKQETGQTMSVVAIGTQMAIEHNYKVLIISTGFQDNVVENCFWENEKGIQIDGNNMNRVSLENGIEGLTKVIQSNRASSRIIRDYTKVVFKDRLDVMLPPKTSNTVDYNELTKFYKNIVEIADKEYDLVLVDIDKRMSKENKMDILKISNVVMMTIKQSIENLEIAQILRENNPVSKDNNIIFLIGKYDFDSKYNIKNITRLLKEAKDVSAVPYNKLFDEACMEGKVVDFILKNRLNSDNVDLNNRFLEEITNTCNNIIYKLQEMQMKL